MKAKLARARGHFPEDDAKPQEANDSSKARIRRIAKRRVLVFGARGLVSRHRHLMLDLQRLLPHHRTDAKFDARNKLYEINEICEMKSCQSCIFFESRKRRDLFLWLSRAPNGPSLKCQVLNVHTMNELNFHGNALAGSRPLMLFDKEFETSEHLQLTKELLKQMFSTPSGHPKSKPFVDHIFVWMLVDGRIWFRNYQILPPKGKMSDAHLKKATMAAMKAAAEAEGATSSCEVIEMGPRFVLDPIRIFGGSFGGPTLYKNERYVTPTAQHLARKRAAQELRVKSDKKKDEKRKRMEGNVLPAHPLKDVFDGDAGHDWSALTVDE